MSLMHRFISVYQKRGNFLIAVNWWVYLRAEPGDPLRTSHTFYWVPRLLSDLGKSLNNFRTSFPHRK